MQQNKFMRSNIGNESLGKNEKKNNVFSVLQVSFEYKMKGEEDFRKRKRCLIRFPMQIYVLKIEF